jgi:hypothetical protein
MSLIFYTLAFLKLSLALQCRSKRRLNVIIIMNGFSYHREDGKKQEEG